jgi:prepilin signal peptidase PulO-like enzyme (type II secretory pathway)
MGAELMSIVTISLAAYLVLVAMLVGSFINLAADRVPRGESLVQPRSHCRSCGRVLDFADLIPVAGYLLRRGRCASCGVAIGAGSPMLEAACGAVMLASLMVLGLGWGAVAGALAAAFIGLARVGLPLVRAGR